MTDNKKDEFIPKSTVAVWGTRQQLCNHGNVSCARTVMSSTAVEAITSELLPKVADIDTDQTTQIDGRILGSLEWPRLAEQIEVLISAHPQLELSSSPGHKEMIEKSQHVAALVNGRKPELAEELSSSIKSICSQACKDVCRQFDLAVAKAPSRVEAVIKELIDGAVKMDRSKDADRHALGRFQKRASQFKNLPGVKGQVKEQTYDNLIRQLIQKAQGEYYEVLKQWSRQHSHNCYKKGLDAVMERFEKFIADSRDFRTKVRLCIEESKKRLDLSKQRLTSLQTGNQIVLEEASKPEFMAALMVSCKVGSQSELISVLRDDFDQRLRQLAEKRGFGANHARQMSFRTLMLTLRESDIVDAFRDIVLEGTSGSHSFYEACQNYGLERLVSDLCNRSRITSWFDGRDNERFGITRYEFLIVRMSKATNPEEIKIKEILVKLFIKAGFAHVEDSSQSRSIAVVRISAGWPVGIEGGNQALLSEYKTSAESGHLPHLVGILPDTKAGEHAEGIMRL